MAERRAVVAIQVALLLAGAGCGGRGDNGWPVDSGLQAVDAALRDAGPQGLDASHEDSGAPDSGTVVDAGFVFGAVEVLASPARAQDLVIDATHLYWVEKEKRCLGSCRIQVKSMPKSGGPQTTLASFPATEWHLAADLHDVYFSVEDEAECTATPCKPNFSLYRLSKTGAPPTFVAYCGTGHFSSDGQNLYCTGWNGEVRTDHQQLLRIPTGGGSPTVLASPVYSPCVTDWGRDVFWTGGEATVMRIPKTGGVATALYENPFHCSNFLCESGTTPHPVPSGLLKVDNQFVYSVDPSQGLFEVPREGGAPKMLHGRGATSIDAHSDQVYWTEDGCLGRIKSDGTDERCLEAGWRVRSVRVDDTFVYYVREYGDLDQIVRLRRALEGQACTPKTCESERRNCGTIADGCGGTVDCGPCQCLFDIRAVDLPANHGAYGAGLNERGTVLARVYFGPQCESCWPEPLLVFPDGSFEKIDEYSPEVSSCYSQAHYPRGGGILGDDNEFVGTHYVWRQGRVTCLGPLDEGASPLPQGQYYWANAVSGGVIVGEADSSSGHRAVAWRGASCSALGPDPLPGQIGSRAWAVGRSGLVAGSVWSDSDDRVALWKTDGSSEALDLNGSPVAVSSADEVLISANGSPFGPNLVYRPDGTLRGLKALPRGDYVFVEDLNAWGWVVGQTAFWYSPLPRAATLWMPEREPEDLNNLLTAPVPTRLVEASAIDDSGRILANDGWSGIYLLTPLPGCLPPGR